MRARARTRPRSHGPDRAQRAAALASSLRKRTIRALEDAERAGLSPRAAAAVLDDLRDELMNRAAEAARADDFNEETDDD